MSSSSSSPADVILAFFGISWASAVARGFIMPEDRLARELLGHPEVRRLLLCDPYRSVAGKAKAVLQRRAEPGLPAGGDARLWSPLRLRRTDPVEPERFIARYEQGMRRAAEAMGMERPAIITVHPLLAGFGDFSWAGPVTYYGWDDWTASVPHQRWWPAYDEAFKRLRAKRRRACAISEDALRRIAPTGPSAVIPNGIEPDEWRSLGEAPAWFTERPRPRMLYAGSLDSRVDAAQAQQVAEAYPDGSLTLIGRLIEPEHFAALQAVPNVHVSGLVGRAEITSIIAAADVCLIPHVRNPLTEAMSPLKLYEYLAGGRPVAAVDLPPIAGVAGRVALAPAGGDLRPAVARALEIGPAPEEERLAFVAEHAWSNRFERLLALALGPEA